MSLQTSTRPALVTAHPAYLSYGLLWLAAAGVIALRGQYLIAGAQAVMLTVVLLLMLLSRRLASPAAGQGPSRAVRVSEGIVLVGMILVTIWYTLVFHRTGSLPFGLKPWTMLIVNPAIMVLAPGVLLLALGVKLPDLGLGKGRRSWLLGLLWSAPYFLWVAVEMILTGTPAPLRILTRAFNSFFMNGFSEEFLWRGAVQTRLERALGNQWGLVLASLLFGIWHVGANLQVFPGDYLGAIAMGVASQSVLGLAFGYLFQRTGNLIAPTLMHIASHLP
ncbi:MAG TPA: CPBP family intramembrane glutamic endopeptidase [Symbiobacteriaceae bacterium]|nr:CPBP family intramembrane glutamic endopeptidase [Symbiobacteriaceae bacterium]